MFEMRLQVTKVNRDNQLEHYEDSYSEKMKVMEELNVSKAKLHVYDRLIMGSIVVVVCLCIVIIVLAL